jgi:drug/metabolite transporter (DMT)-like permease
MEKTATPMTAWFLLILLSLIWGSSFILMFLGLGAFSPLEVALIRMSVAAICLLPFLIKFIPSIKLKDLPLFLVIGLTGNGIPAFLFAMSETVLPTAVVGVLNSMSPIFTLLLGYLFFQMRFPLLNVIGILVGFVGASLLAMSGSDKVGLDTNLAYSLLVVAATICYGISTNLIKQKSQNHHPVFVATMALSLVGWPSLVALLLGTDVPVQLANDSASLDAFGYIAILGAIGTAFGVAMFNKMLKISSIIFASSVTYTIPVVAVLWGIMLYEPLSWVHGLGFLIILVGVWLANRK